MYQVEYYNLGEEILESVNDCKLSGWLKILDIFSLQQFILDKVKSGGVIVSIHKV